MSKTRGARRGAQSDPGFGYLVPGADLVEMYARLEAEVAEAVRQENEWLSLEEFFLKHFELFTYSICGDCRDRHYPDFPEDCRH